MHEPTSYVSEQQHPPPLAVISSICSRSEGSREFPSKLDSDSCASFTRSLNIWCALKVIRDLSPWIAVQVFVRYAFQQSLVRRSVNTADEFCETQVF
jgi:hypothetical protein